MTSFTLACLLSIAPSFGLAQAPTEPPAAPPVTPVPAAEQPATPATAELKLPPVAKAPPPADPVTLPSGVIIQDIAPSPIADAGIVKQGDIIIVSYTGTLKDTGAPFDASVPGSPLILPLTRAIKGWQEGVPGMKIGAKRAITVPAALAFGDKGLAPRVPPKADLVFDIELLDALQIIDEKVGDGEMVEKNASVSVIFRGMLKADGSEVDSSKGKPYTISLNEVVLGWKYGLLGMKVGGKRKLIVPWQLGYGETGNPPVIPGRANLVFELELTAVANPKPVAPAAGVPAAPGNGGKPAPAETTPPAQPK